MRCKVCSLSNSRRVQIERWVRNGTPLRHVSEILKKDGIIISYGGIRRHTTYHVCKVNDDFVESMQEFRPVAITVNVDSDIRRALGMKQRVFHNRLKRRGYRRRATMSSVVNYFLRKGANVIANDKEQADQALYEFMRQRASFVNFRKRRVEGRPLSMMISNELHRKLWVDIRLAVWHSKSFEELLGLWKDAVGHQLEEHWARLPVPSLTDYVNLALRVGLGA